MIASVRWVDGLGAEKGGKVRICNCTGLLESGWQYTEYRMVKIGKNQRLTLKRKSFSKMGWRILYKIRSDRVIVYYG